MQREHLRSRLGFLLLSAGCAIGVGNVWKFPWMAGQYGGGAFVVIYLLFLVALGVPVLTMELAMGRAAQKSPVKMYPALQNSGKWNWHGYVCLAGNICLMMFYTTVAGWMLQYFVDTARGVFVGMDTAAVETAFGTMLSSPWKMVCYMGIVVVSGFFIISKGVQKGLEKVTKSMMVALMVLTIALAVNSVFLEGGAEGLKFYLIPNVQKMKEVGIGDIIVGAMNQSFFTLSLGIGAMAIFGSYIGKEQALMGEAFRICGLDTLVALSAGLIIFPACSAYGVDVTQGPPLIFVTLPNVFNHLPLGRLWGSLFFLFMTFAAYSTILAVFENIVSCIIELTNWSRKKTCLICCIGIFLLSLPCLLGYNAWSNIHPLPGHDIQETEDFLVSNIMLPLGSLIFVIFCTTRYGWGFQNFLKEANEGKGMKFPRWMRSYVTYVLPVIVMIIFVAGMISFFGA
ncbi:MAG TPA: sodium-dependent transporter [Candidatus Faecousia faecavium]|nr:sodium-dependent transporter [Candidatus Faecousia faecavium]